MRFPEAKIKEAILHPDLEIRARAVRYFANEFSTDPFIMPLVIQAVQTHGKQEAYRLIGPATGLRQTDDIIAWVIAELNDEQTGQFENYAYNLSRVLLQADPTLLLPREEAVLQARHFLPSLGACFTERLRMASWDMATCWQKLEEFCEEGKDKQHTNEVDLGYAKRIVEALAHYGKECEEKVHALLSMKMADFSHSPMKWLEPLVVRLAGQAHLESTLHLLIAKLHEDSDLLDEECAEALTRIGTAAVLEAVAEAFPSAEHHFRLYATESLEYIHSDLAVEKGLALLRQEKELGIQRNLAHVLLSQFAHEGIEAARELLGSQELAFEGRGLRYYLLQTCTIMGERFPEYDEWMETEKIDTAEAWKTVTELEAEIVKNKLEIERLKAEIAEKEKALSGQARSQATRPPHGRERRIGVSSSERARIGRNDLCPCGSGKKFKHCCMRKQGSY